MGKAATRFFVILMPWGRVGSNLVTASLETFSEVKIDNEPTTRLKTFARHTGLPSAAIAEQQFEHLSAFHKAYREAGGAAGLKLSYRSLIEPHDYTQRLVTLGFRPIVMLRDNFLHCAVSQMRAVVRAEATEKGQTLWRSPWAVAMDEPKPGPTRIDPGEAIRLTREFEKHHWALLQTVGACFGQNAMKIEYSELAYDPRTTIRKILLSIGLFAPSGVCVPQKKATSDKLSDDITNYAEFADAVHAAGLSHFLEDV